VTPPTGAQFRETRIRVRFAETDLMGIAHHSSYVIYLEEGRVDFTRQINAPYADLEAEGYSLAVSELSIRYGAPARFDQVIVVRTWIEEAKSRMVTFGYDLIEQESQATLVTAVVRLICVDKSGQVRRIPENWLKIMQSYALKV
jgi:acyl-CoA thioester hydrolase